MYTHYLQFLKDWNNPKHQFKIHTSGSTGKAKEIALERDKLKYSAALTKAAILDVENHKTLCCLPANKMGGFMPLVRAVIWNTEIEIIEPSLDPMQSLSEVHDFKNISISPVQLISIIENQESFKKLLQFATILIGGSSLHEDYVAQLSKTGHSGFFLTYGMTETYSHIALRNIPNKGYLVLREIDYRISDDGTLSLRSKLTNGLWIETNDIIEELENRRLSFKGRKDNVINSGGIKFKAEELENCIAHFINFPFYIGSSVDSKLGEVITLFIEKMDNNELAQINEGLKNAFGKYAKIRRVINRSIEVDTITGKIKRKYAK